jgi:hypothetical protein
MQGSHTTTAYRPHQLTKPPPAFITAASWQSAAQPTSGSRLCVSYAMRSVRAARGSLLPWMRGWRVWAAARGSSKATLTR